MADLEAVFGVMQHSATKVGLARASFARNGHNIQVGELHPAWREAALSDGRQGKMIHLQAQIRLFHSPPGCRSATW